MNKLGQIGSEMNEEWANLFMLFIIAFESFTLVARATEKINLVSLQIYFMLVYLPPVLNQSHYAIAAIHTSLTQILISFLYRAHCKTEGSL